MTILSNCIRAVMVLAVMTLQACVTTPDNSDKVAQGVDTDCYATGSLIKIRSSDCRQALKDRGVQTADPKEMKSSGTTPAGPGGSK